MSSLHARRQRFAVVFSGSRPWFSDGCHGQREPLREHPGVGEVGGEAKGLLGGAEGIGRLVVALEGQGQVVVNVGAVGKPVGRPRGNRRWPGAKCRSIR